MTDRKMGEEKTYTPYKDNFEHLADELRKVDLLLRQEVIKFRQRHEKIWELSAKSAAYVSHEEVDILLHAGQTGSGKSSQTGSGKSGKTGKDKDDDNEKDQNSQPGHQVDKELEILQGEIDARVAASMEAGVFLALPQLANLFNLSPFEKEVVMICLAPGLRRKYARIFAYLHDDISRKKPGIDLVVDMLCKTEAQGWNARTIFSPHAPLIRSGILQATEEGFLKLDPRILNFLLGNNRIDKRLLGPGKDMAILYRPSVSLAADDLLIDPAIKSRLMNMIREHLDRSGPGGKRLVLHFQGPRGVGKRDLALGICYELNCFLLYLDMELLLAKEPESETGTLLRLAFREMLLLQAVLYIDNIDVLVSGDFRLKSLLKSLSRMAAEYGWLTILAGEDPWSPGGLFESAVFHSTRLGVPAVELRQKAWERVLEDENITDQDKITWAEELARQFRLTPVQIRDALEFVRYHYIMGSGSEQKNLTLEHLYAACRSQSNQKLTELALKIDPKYGWKDIVLSEEKILVLKDICSHVKYRHRVFGQWGFGEKLSYGKGLSVLFSGTPGTGKTMAAEVIAHELQLDLYKIDLSRVVSKYIGETEKNLAKIFHEAETSNAIIFFDEADALFGKRTEIKDAHDRYANIETSYLLQKVEEYEGVVILATNFSKNMDEGFTRRLRFIMEFPFPDEKSRYQIWKIHFPEQAPLSKDIDYELLARNLPVTGGSIRNIALNAAFYAAQDDGIIEMSHILNGARREYEKIGKIWSQNNFYHEGQEEEKKT